jgi:hypothetical protein
MEDNAQNSDEIINKAISDPEATIQSLDKAKEAIQQLMNTKKEAESSMQNEAEKDEEANWSFGDTIDTLLSRLTGGYTYYDLPWDRRHPVKFDEERYNIQDESGDTVETTDKDGVIDYANTVFHYDMQDNEEGEFKTFEQAKEALESEGNFKVINTKDTNQLSLFPSKKVEPRQPSYDTVISKMDPIAYEGLLDKLGNKSWIVKKVVELLKNDEQQEAYKELRRILDVLKEETEKIEKSLVNSDIFRIIAESEKPKLNKSDILDYIKKQKKS